MTRLLTVLFIENSYAITYWNRAKVIYYNIGDDKRIELSMMLRGSSKRADYAKFVNPLGSVTLYD